MDQIPISLQLPKPKNIWTAFFETFLLCINDFSIGLISMQFQIEYIIHKCIFYVTIWGYLHNVWKEN